MPKLAANLDWLFTDLPYLERFEAAARAGFKGVELLNPYDHTVESLTAALRDNDLKLILMNAALGDWNAGDRGLASLPGREADFAADIEQALSYARALGCPRLHVMAGVPPADADPAACRAVFRSNLTEASATLNRHGIMALVEPINSRDMPGYFLSRQDDALAHLGAAGAPNGRLQMDLYHCQIMEGDLATKIRRNIDRIGHFQIAGVPDRHEPDEGELDYPYLLDLIDSLGFQGWIGCEYRPRADTHAGLGWARAYGLG